MKTCLWTLLVVAAISGCSYSDSTDYRKADSACAPYGGLRGMHAAWVTQDAYVITVQCANSVTIKLPGGPDEDQGQ